MGRLLLEIDLAYVLLNIGHCILPTSSVSQCANASQCADQEILNRGATFGNAAATAAIAAPTPSTVTVATVAAVPAAVTTLAATASAAVTTATTPAAI